MRSKPSWFEPKEMLQLDAPCVLLGFEKIFKQNAKYRIAIAIRLQHFFLQSKFTPKPKAFFQCNAPSAACQHLRTLWFRLLLLRAVSNQRLLTATAPAEKGFDEPAASNHEENSEEEEYREDDQEVEDEVC